MGLPGDHNQIQSGGIKLPGMRWMILLAMGFIGVLGIYFFYQTVYFLEGGIKTQGVFVRDIHVKRGSRGGGSFYWKVGFTTAEGQRREINTPASNFFLEPKIGDDVTVYYDPANPTHAQLGTFFQMWLIPGLLTFLGLGGVGYGFRWRNPGLL